MEETASEFGVTDVLDIKPECYDYLKSSIVNKQVKVKPYFKIHLLSPNISKMLGMITMKS